MSASVFVCSVRPAGVSTDYIVTLMRFSPGVFDRVGNWRGARTLAASGSASFRSE